MGFSLKKAFKSVTKTVSKAADAVGGAVQKVGRDVDLTNPAALKRLPGRLVTTYNPMAAATRAVTTAGAAAVGKGNAANATWDKADKVAQEHPKEVILGGIGTALIVTGVGATVGVGMVGGAASSVAADEARKAAERKAAQQQLAEQTQAAGATYGVQGGYGPGLSIDTFPRWVVRNLKALVGGKQASP